MQARLNVLRVLWSALLASVLLLAGVAVMTGHLEPMHPESSAQLVIPLSAVGVVVAVMSVLMPRVLYVNIAKAQLPRAGALIDVSEYRDQGQHGFREVAPAVRYQGFADPALAESVVFAGYQTPFILGMALAEAVAHFGFVLAFLGQGLVRAWPFFAVAVALQAARFPTRASILRAFEDATNTRFPDYATRRADAG